MKKLVIKNGCENLIVTVQHPKLGKITVDINNLKEEEFQGYHTLGINCFVLVCSKCENEQCNCIKTVKPKRKPNNKK